MKHIFKTISLPVFALFTMAAALPGCTKFLEQRPSKNSSLPIETTAHLNALLERYGSFYRDENQSWMHTDDMGLTKELYDARPSQFTYLPTIFNAFGQNEMMAQQTTGDLYWGTTSGDWTDVFYANSILTNVEKVSGTADEKARIKADAHLLRAYAYIQLANTYCLPYTEANKNEMGLPIKVSTSFEEDLTRKSLAETYAFIEADLQEALKITKPLSVNGRPEHWRSSTAAANAVAARYFLTINKYAEALTHADKVLSEYNVLVDYNAASEMYYGTNATVTVDGGTPNSRSVTVRFPYTHNNQTSLIDMLGWKEFIYFRTLAYGSWWFIPSRDLLNLYDVNNDRRYEYHIVEDFSYVSGMNTAPSYSYPGYVFFFKDRLPAGPTTAEMYLIKAEAQARTGDVAGALQTVNTLRAKRIRPGASVNLTAANQAEAITKILQERRREMPFVHRFSDIRRFNANNDPSDDVEVTKVFYPFTVGGPDATKPAQTYIKKKNDRSWALPIPLQDILSSNGQLQQNTY